VGKFFALVASKRKQAKPTYPLVKKALANAFGLRAS